jgi:molybdate transport system ATP-binding protein
MSEPLIELHAATVRRGGRCIFSGLDWSIRAGQAWAIVGPTGSGKTTLAELLLGKHGLASGSIRWPMLDRIRAAGGRADYPSQVIAHVTFKEESRLFSYVGHYYQQRFEFADEDEPLSLEQFLRSTRTPPEEIERIAARLGLSPHLGQPFMTLSNGQTRRARLARALLGKPALLVLDDPFVGLDAGGRVELAELLGGLVREGRHIVLICREDAVPAWITNVLRTGEHSEAREAVAKVEPALTAGGEPIIELERVTVRHSGRAILDEVSWTVRAGERWAVVGPNGSGKTTLLSLLCGDHPQAYANEIRLFGRKRGSGETIWDVKRNVGLLSPEFHLYFSEPLTAERTVATGFFDSLSDRPITDEQTARIRDLFAAFGIAYLRERPFRTLSTGEQRLVLLLRALVKRPALLILDEPFQGLDLDAMHRCRAWLDREVGTDQTLLFVTHDPSELPRSVNRTLRLAAGRIAVMK